MFYDDATSWRAKPRGTRESSQDALAPMGAQGESCMEKFSETRVMLKFYVQNIQFKIYDQFKI